MIYLVGGSDGTTPKTEVYWTMPDASGNIGGWQHLSQTDLPARRRPGWSVGHGQRLGGVRRRRHDLERRDHRQRPGEPGAPAAVLRPGPGRGDDPGHARSTATSASSSATSSAAGAGTVDFILLILIGWAFAHKERTKELLAKLRRRRH